MTEAGELGPQYAGDNAFTAQMRLHQSWWRRDRLDVPAGTDQRANVYGNYLDADAAANTSTRPARPARVTASPGSRSKVATRARRRSFPTRQRHHRGLASTASGGTPTADRPPVRATTTKGTTSAACCSSARSSRPVASWQVDPINGAYVRLDWLGNFAHEGIGLDRAGNLYLGAETGPARS